MCERTCCKRKSRFFFHWTPSACHFWTGAAMSASLLLPRILSGDARDWLAGASGVLSTKLQTATLASAISSRCAGDCRWGWVAVSHAMTSGQRNSDGRFCTPDVTSSCRSASHTYGGGRDRMVSFVNAGHLCSISDLAAWKAAGSGYVAHRVWLMKAFVVSTESSL